jgi:hypothetical protein
MKPNSLLLSCQILFSVILLGLFGSPANASIPDWLATACKMPTPPNCGNANGVVLLDQTRLDVNDTGIVSRVHRVAVRILTKQGSDLANAFVGYIDTSERVRTNDAWLTRLGKSVQSFSGKTWQDLAAADSGAIYNEFRVKSVDCSGEAIADDVFGYETRVEGKPLFNQFFETFGGALPVLEKQFQINVPVGWRIQAAAENSNTLTSSVSANGCSQSWVLHQRPFQPSEPWSAPIGGATPVVHGSFAPPEDMKAGTMQFRNWEDVAAWQLRMAEPQCDFDQQLRIKADQLVAGCSDTAARVRAVCAFVQNLQYVANNRNLGLGFGYRPRKASEVVAKGYGDCKDKVNALRALLREAGMRSHPVTVLADDDPQIWAAWPSPMQFNHVIVGIEVDEGIKFPATISTRQWGRLLLFDPTDANTPLGGLPWILQGTKGLVNVENCDGLFDLPVLPSEQDWLVSRKVTMKLLPTGSVSGQTSLITYGQAGAETRNRLRNATARDLQVNITAALSGALPDVQVTNIKSADESEADNCSLKCEFAARKFAQLMPGSLAIVRLNVFGRGNIPTFTEKTRETPVMIHPIEQRDDITLELPAGFSVAECPANCALDSPYGRCIYVYELQKDTVRLHRSFTLFRRRVEPSDYAALRKFISDASKASQGTILLHTN